MNGKISSFLTALTLLFLFSTTFVFPLSPDEYLEEAPDLENILSDLPPGFDFSGASEAELRRIPFLSPQDIERIILLRESISGQNLQNDPYGLMERVSPLVRFLLDDPWESFASKKNAGAVNVRGGFVIPRGEFPESGRQYLKITAASGKKYRFFALGERDPFESRALDLASLGLSFPVERLNSRLVLGDFRPGFGMGLLFARYPVYFSADRPRYYSSVTPLNTSFEETRFMRGGMLITRTGWFESCLWTSMRRLDATLEEGKAVTIDDTGLHPAGSPQGNLEEQITGAQFSFGDDRNEFSVTGALSRYSPGFFRPEGEKYFGRPETASFPQFSVAGRTRRGTAEFSFEHARMSGGEHATLGGVAIDSGRAVTSLLVRDYSPGYWAPRSGAPAAFGNTSNEQGIYSSLNVSLPARLYLTASLDLAKMLGRSWSRPMPVSRTQFFFSLRKRIRSRLEGSLAIRSTGDAESGSRRWSLRGRLESSPVMGRGWGWRGTAAWSAGEDRGGPFAEGMFFRKRNGGKISLSLGGFRIPSYLSRYYIYLPDVPGRGGTAGVWGNGYSASVVCSIGPLSGRIRMADSDLMSMQREITLQTDFSF